MSKLKVAILGLGPAGTYAALAGVDEGVDVTVYAMKDRGTGKGSPGAFYLHWLPFYLAKAIKPQEIFIHGTGTEEGYRHKQWGSLSNKVGTSSFPSEGRSVMGYDPRCLSVLPPSVKRMTIDKPITDLEVKLMREEYDLIFQTFPTEASRIIQPPLLSYWVLLVGVGADPEQNYIEYDGTAYSQWIRLSQLWGSRYIEFPKGMSWEDISDYSALWAASKHVEVKDFHPDTQPLTSQNIGIHFIGRWATWDKRWLSHMAYDYVSNTIKQTLGVQDEQTILSGPWTDA